LKERERERERERNIEAYFKSRERHTNRQTEKERALPLIDTERNRERVLRKTSWRIF